MAEKPLFNESIVRQLADILNETHLTEIEYETEGCRVRVKRQLISQTTIPTYAPAVPAFQIPQPAMTSSAAAEGPATQSVPHDHRPGSVKAPMVGTVYLSPTPGSPAFVKVGDAVQKGQTLCIIEAMKVMNQIKASKEGVVREIFVHDAQPVEFDQVLLIVD